MPFPHHPHFRTAFMTAALLLVTLAPAVGQDSTQAEADATPERTPAGPVGEAAPTSNPSIIAGAETAPVSVKVQLILVRSDWSHAKNPEGAKKDLESLLEDVALPGDFRKDLLGSASRILFPEGLAAGYQPEQLADSLAWMKEHDLLRVELPAKSLAPDSSRKKQPDTAPHACRLFVGEDVVPIPTTRERSEAPPFFKRQYGWQWQCMSRLRMEETTTEQIVEIGIQRFSARRDDPQVDGQSPHFSATSEGKPIGMEFPAELAAVVRCFGPNDEEMYDVVRKQGWEPLLVISPLDLENAKIETPKLALPTSLLELGEPTILESTKLVEVFRLRNAKATELGPLLQAVISDGRLTVDEQKNSLVAYGTRAELDTLKALLTRIDAVPTGSQDSSGETNTATSTDQQIKVFQLKNSDAAQTEVMAKQLFKDIGIEADKRTNSLIVAGTPDDLDIIEAILLRLDQTPTKSQAPPTTDDSLTADLDSTRNEFSAKEAEVRSLAQGISEEDDTEAAEELQARLNRLVTEAFDLRQKLQRAELALLKERIQIVETRLQQRDTLRDEIIRRRVENLLAGEFDGNSPERTPVASTADAPRTVGATRPIHANGVPGTMAAGLWLSDDVIHLLSKDDRAAAWQVAYKEQCSRNAWPPPLSPQFHKCIETLGQDAAIPSVFCEEYQKFIRAHAPSIDTLIDRRRPKKVAAGYGVAPDPELEGIVEWNDADYARIQAGFYWVKRPSTSQVRLAQEDLWCYESVLRAIAKTNKDAGASSHADAPIKRIETLEIGQPAAVAMAAVRPRMAFLAYFGKAHQLTEGAATEDPVDSADTVAEDAVEGPVTDERVARILRTGRYVDLSGKPLPADSRPYPEFNLLPVQIIVDIVPACLSNFLVQFADCAMPVDVMHVDVQDRYGEEASEGIGAPVREQLFRVEILGVIRLFNPPDKSQLDATVVQAGFPDDVLVRMDFTHQPWKDVLQWLAEVSGTELDLVDALPDGVFDFACPSPESVASAKRTIAENLRLSGYSLSVVPCDDGPKLRIQETTAGQARREAVAATEEVDKWTKAYMEASDVDYRVALGMRLDVAEDALDRMRMGLIRSLNERWSHFQKSLATLNTARQEMKTTDRLLADGHITQAERDASQEELDQLSDQCVNLRIDIALYRDAAETLGLSEEDIEKAETEEQPADDHEMNQSEAYPAERPGDKPKTPQRQPIGPTQAGSATFPTDSRPTLPLRSPADFLSAARDATKEVNQLQGQLNDRDDLEKAGYKDVVDRIEQDLASAKQRLELIQTEYATQLQLLETELQKAQSAAAITERECISVRETIDRIPDAFTDTQVAKYIHKRDEDKLRVDQAKALLELYQKAGESPDLKPTQSDAPSTVNELDNPATNTETHQSMPPAEKHTTTSDWATPLFLETRHDFGAVDRDKKLEYHFKLQNIYKEDVHIAEVIPSHPGLSARIIKPLVNVHETSEIVVELGEKKFHTVSSQTAPKVTVVFDRPYHAQVDLHLQWAKRAAEQTKE